MNAQIINAVSYRGGKIGYVWIVSEENTYKGIRSSEIDWLIMLNAPFVQFHVMEENVKDVENGFAKTIFTDTQIVRRDDE